MGAVEYTTALSRLKLQRKTLRVALLTLFTILSIPALVIITIPIFLFRFLNQLWVHYMHKDHKHILKILEPMGQVFANDYFKANPRFTIVDCWVGEGNIRIEDLRQRVTIGILEKESREGKDAVKGDSRKHIFPELKCEIVSVGGYHYFRKIENFDIKDHVRMLEHTEYGKTIGSKNKKVIGENDFRRIIAHMTSNGWRKGRSAWEFILIDNYVDDSQQKSDTPKLKSLVVTRIHHSLADGYGFINMTEGLGDTNLKKMSAVPSANLKRKINPGFETNRPLLGWLLLPLFFPYQVALTIDRLLQKDSNEWRVPKEKLAKAGKKYFHSQSRNISVSGIKEIKRKFGVSFQAVLNSLIAGGVHKVMVEIGQKVPEKMAAFLPIPLPGHSEGLSNYFGFVMCRLPVGETNPILRLKLADEELQHLGDSATPLVIYLTYVLVGLYPSIVSRMLMFADLGCTLLVSSFPANDSLNYCFNCKCTDTTFTLGNVGGSIGATLTTTTLGENVKMAITVDEQVCPTEYKIETFHKSIYSEVKVLLGIVGKDEKNQQEKL